MSENRFLGMPAATLRAVWRIWIADLTAQVAAALELRGREGIDCSKLERIAAGSLRRTADGAALWQAIQCAITAGKIDRAAAWLPAQQPDHTAADSSGADESEAPEYARRRHRGPGYAGGPARLL